MTTNIERAIEIIEDEHDPHFGPIDAPSLIYALNDAGLLKPDTPMAEEVEYRAVSKHPDSILGPGSTIRSSWYPTRDEAVANRDPRVMETCSRLIGIEHRYVTQPRATDD